MAGTRTFLFTDIEGSTRLEEDIGTARYAAVRERHRELLRAAFAAGGGLEQGTEGDSFFVVFPTAGDGLAAAIAAQRALLAEAWPDDVSVKVRMGLHAGEAQESGGSLVGLDVNRAARIAATAHGGQIVVSDAVRSLVSGALPPEVTLRGLGSHRLRDLRDPEPLAQVVAPDLPDTFPPLRSIDARPNNLPTQLTSFVGREAELAAAGDLLARSRLVTLTGPGGTGKTRLSLQVATKAAEAFPDGIFFVALETVREPVLVPSRLAAAIGIAEPARRTAAEVVEEWLAGKQVLFVLDNLEQVLGVGPIVADLLRKAPGLKVLATSRAPLQVSGEQEFPVPGLPTPPDPTQLTALERAELPAEGRVVDVAALETYEAVRLFIARATAVRPGFEVTNENAPAVAAICSRLHGMPLAIELAAARVKLLSPDAILGRLEHQLGVLAAGARDLPERQQTLRGAIAWSYDILDEPCRVLLARLSVFVGDIELEAAEAVCGPASEVGQDVTDGVLSLATQSLLRTIENPDAPRFEMLDTIREYAGEKLAERGDQAELERRHGTWHLEFATRASAELSGDDQRVWLERFEHAHDNLRAAMDRAAARADGEIAIGIAFHTWRFWQKRGHLYEARRRLEALAGEPWSRRDPRLRARLLEALGGVCWWQGEVRPMREAYREAVELWRGADEPGELANALYNYSFAFTVPDELPESGAIPETDPSGEGRAALDEALAIYRGLGDERGEANVLWGIGNMRYFSRTGDTGAEAFALALEKFIRVGDRTMEAWSRHQLGAAYIRLDRLDEARELIQDALRFFYQASDTAGLTLVLDDLSAVAVAAGDNDRAARLWGAARSLTSSTGANLAGFVDAAVEYDSRPNIRRAIGRDELARLGAEGAAMSLDELMAYALGGAEDSAVPSP
ncbi:MAG TPA: adenylate/guanylate cyclase domain-containing protein [Candidatus Limnocylindrales bacterium]